MEVLGDLDLLSLSLVLLFLNVLVDVVGEHPGILALSLLNLHVNQWFEGVDNKVGLLLLDDFFFFLVFVDMRTSFEEKLRHAFVPVLDLFLVLESTLDSLLVEDAEDIGNALLHEVLHVSRVLIVLEGFDK